MKVTRYTLPVAFVLLAGLAGLARSGDDKADVKEKAFEAQSIESANNVWMNNQNMFNRDPGGSATTEISGLYSQRKTYADKANTLATVDMGDEFGTLPYDADQAVDLDKRWDAYARWEQIAQDVPEVGEVRGVGAMIGVEMVMDRGTKEPNEAFLGALIRGAVERGVVAVSCGVYHNVLRHVVPLVITDEELDEGLDVLAESALASSGPG